MRIRPPDATRRRRPTSLSPANIDRQIVYTLGQCFHEYFPAIGIFSREREWFVYSLSQIDVTVTSVTVISYTYFIVRSLYWDTIVGAGSPIEEEQEEKEKDEDSIGTAGRRDRP